MAFADRMEEAEKQTKRFRAILQEELVARRWPKAKADAARKVVRDREDELLTPATDGDGEAWRNEIRRILDTLPDEPPVP